MGSATHISSIATVRAQPGATGVSVVAGRQEWSQGADIASAASVTVPVDGNLFAVTGSTQIDSITGVQAGTKIALWFNGTVPISAAGNILPKGGLRTPIADELVIFESRDNGGLEWVEVASSVSASGGDFIIDTSGSGYAGGDKSAIGTVGSKALDIQSGRAAAAQTASGYGSLALGYDANAAGITAVAIGYQPRALQQGQVAIGNAANANADAAAAGSVAIGDGATVTQALPSIAIGAGANVDGNTVYGASSVSVAIGTNAYARNRSVVIGAQAASTATGGNAVAIGNGAQTYYESIAIGRDTVAKNGAISIGDRGGNQAINSVCIGDLATISAAAGLSVVVGRQAASTGARGVAIGGSTSAGQNAVAIGGNASAASGHGIAIGYNAALVGSDENSIAIGRSASATSAISAVCIGHTARTDSSGADFAIAIGFNSEVTTPESVVIGADAYAQSQECVVLGIRAEAQGTQLFSSERQICIGADTFAALNANRAIAIGVAANVSGSYQVAIGPGATCTRNSSSVSRGVAVGHNATVANQSLRGGIALGGGSVSGGEGSISLGYAAKSYGTKSIAIGRYSTAYDGNTILIGHDTVIDTSSDALDAGIIAIGNSNTFTGLNGIRCTVIGHNNTVDDDGHIIIGNNHQKTGSYLTSKSVVIGNGNSATVRYFGAENVIIGSSAEVTAVDSLSGNGCIAIGSSAGGIAQAGYSVALSVAIGRNAKAFNASNSISINADSNTGTYGIGLNGGVYGSHLINLNSRINSRPWTMRIGATPLVGWSYNTGTNGGGAANASGYGSYRGGFPAVLSAGLIDMPFAYTGPVRRWWYFPVNTSFFIDSISVIATDLDTLTTHGNLEATGLNRSATTTTVSSTAAAGANVAVSVASEAGFSAGDWVLFVSGTPGSLGEEVTGIGKVDSTAAGTLTIDLITDFSVAVSGNTVIKLDGSDGNISASAIMTGITTAKQREVIATEQNNGYDVVVLARTATATATTLLIVPQLRGVLQELVSPWTY